jgi:deaminated glutathione amidase
MKISLIQMNSRQDKAANIATASELIEQAVANERPDWVGLPECFDFLGGQRADKQQAAEILGEGPAYLAVQALARRHGIFIHAGSILEKIPGEDRLHNTSVVFDRAGHEIARYRKIHMFDVVTPDGAQYRESASFKPGTEVVTYQAEDFTFGCAICYDLRFPDLFQALAEKGADVIALPSAFTLLTGKDHWDVLCRARAIETETYFLAPAQTGAHIVGNETRATYGHSLVADPWGHVIARASDGVGSVSTRIERTRIAKVRAQIPVAQHKIKLR